MRNVRREVLALLGVSLLPTAAWSQNTEKPVINPPPTARDWADLG